VKKFLILTTMVVMGSMVMTGVTAASASAGSVAGSGAPMIGAGTTGKTYSGLPTISLNWSGYAVTGKTPFNYVSSEFTVPAVTCNGTAHVYTSNWVGLDGFNDDTVEQDGTAAFCQRPTYETPIYYAWIEMFPAPTVETFRVSPGDVISASVRYTNGKFNLTITDVTKGLTKTVTSACSSCERASAEWIIERPAGCNKTETKCFLFALANFGTSTLSENVASEDGGPVTGLSAYPNAHQIFMVQNTPEGGFYALDNVGTVSPGDNSFGVQFLHSGHVTPISLGPKS
jgi:hypothetical protein